MRKLSMSATIAFLAAIMTLGVASQALALLSSKPSLIDFGMVGITAGQTARLNVINIGSPDNKGCLVELTFLDSVGSKVDTFTVNVAIGESVFNDLEGDRIAGSEPDRAQIRAVVLRNLNQGDRCNIIPTLEIYDNDTGRATLLIGNPSIVKNPNLIEDILNLDLLNLGLIK